MAHWKVLLAQYQILKHRENLESIRYSQGTIDPCGLLMNIESQILKGEEESLSRKDIMDRKFYGSLSMKNDTKAILQDSKRYSSGRDAHVNVKRAEKAGELFVYFSRKTHIFPSYAGQPDKPYLCLGKCKK
uniref:Uncharacterized protein n=1 Tax=Aegilops tauschii TaxID=37682 RepID=M8ALQ2_AEGTA